MTQTYEKNVNSVLLGHHSGIYNLYMCLSLLLQGRKVVSNQYQKISNAHVPMVLSDPRGSFVSQDRWSNILACCANLTNGWSHSVFIVKKLHLASSRSPNFGYSYDTRDQRLMLWSVSTITSLLELIAQW